MLPDPLHPALVHFPIVLAALAPLLAAGLLFATATGRAPARAWLAVVVLQAVVAGGGWITAETGEEEEERVEAVVPHDPIEAHEEAAEWFVRLAFVALPIAAAGLVAGRVGRVARGLTVVATLIAALAVARVGHTGGQLVYVHGAAIAYLDAETAAGALTRATLGDLLGGKGRRQREDGSGPGRREEVAR